MRLSLGVSVIASLLVLGGCGEGERPGPEPAPGPAAEGPVAEGPAPASAAPAPVPRWLSAMPELVEVQGHHVRGHFVAAVQGRLPPEPADRWVAMTVTLPDGASLDPSRTYRVDGNIRPPTGSEPPHLTVSAVHDPEGPARPPVIVPGQRVAGLPLDRVADALERDVDLAPFRGADDGSMSFETADVPRFTVGETTTPLEAGWPEVLGLFHALTSGPVPAGWGLTPCEEWDADEGVAFDCGTVEISTVEPAEPSETFVVVRRAP